MCQSYGFAVEINAGPKFEIEKDPEVSGPNVPALNVLAPQVFDEVCVKIAALACSAVKKHLKRKIFQLATKPRIKRNGEPVPRFA
jgi:hypothetical protein